MGKGVIRLVEAGWDQELEEAIRAEPSEIRIVCPFIKRGPLERLLPHAGGDIKVVTRFNLPDFVVGVSDVEALQVLLDAGADIRGIRNLHAKLYLFGTGRAIITSANLTEAALTRNQEFGLVADDEGVVATCWGYFDRLWGSGGSNLSREMVDSWSEDVIRHRIAGGISDRARGPDFGADVGLAATVPVSLRAVVADADQAFVKFLGEGHYRAPVSCTSMEVIQESGCHWALCYPANKRPSSPLKKARMREATIVPWCGSLD